MTHSRRGTVLLAAVALLLGACTTVPTTSEPQVIRPVDNGAKIQAPRSCGPRHQLARSAVTSFLRLNASANFNVARTCLTRNGRGQWAPASTVTIIDNETISNLHKGVVRVIGREAGQLVNGVYNPSLAGDGSGLSGQQFPVSFRMKHVRGQWRIDSVQPNGRLVTKDQFEDFNQQNLYFFDVSETKLVPVPVYTQIADSQELARWLVSELAAGPATNALASALPGQPDPNQVTVRFPPDGAGLYVRVDIPGVSQLGGASLSRLAVQLAATLLQAGAVRIAITDQGAPVRIGPGTSFTPDAVLHNGANQYVAQPTSGALFYLDNGALYQVVGSSSRPVPGKVGTGVYALSSVAVTLPQGSPNLRIAGVRGIGAGKYLLIGSQEGTLHPTNPKVSGDLSRPAWAPGGEEVWVGNGRNLQRVLVHSNTAQTVPVEPALPPKSYITAVQFSPEGARVALVVSESPVSSRALDITSQVDATAQIYVGTVVRTGTRVRVAGLTAISPAGVHVNDVAWYDTEKLFAIGSYRATRNPATFEVQVDGSLWTYHSAQTLPGSPDSLTVADGTVAVVAVGTSLWRQDGASWVSLLGGEGGFAPGTDPTYIE